MNGNYYFRGDKADYPDLVERDDFRFGCKWVEEKNYGYIDYVEDGENLFLLSWVTYPEGEAFDMNVLPSNLNFSFGPALFENLSVVMRQNIAHLIGERAFANATISGKIELAGVKEIGDEAFDQAKFDSDAHFSLDISQIESAPFENADMQGHSLYIENSLHCFVKNPYAFSVNNASYLEYHGKYAINMTETLFINADEIKFITDEDTKEFLTVIDVSTEATKIHIEGPSRVVSLSSDSTIETLRLINLSRIEDYAISAQAIGYIYLQDVSSAGSSIFGYLSTTPIIEIGGSEEDIKNFDPRWNCFNQTVYPYSFVTPLY